MFLKKKIFFYRELLCVTFVACRIEVISLKRGRMEEADSWPDPCQWMVDQLKGRLSRKSIMEHHHHDDRYHDHRHHHNHHHRHHHHHHDSPSGVTFSRTIFGIFIFVLSLLIPHVLADPKDLRYVSYTDFHLINSTTFYHNNDIDNYQHAVVDDNNNRIIIGARDHLVTFRMDDFTQLQVIPWLADHKQVEMCKILGHPESECRNFIKVLLINGTSLFMCGTFAHKPMCQTRPLSNLKHVTRQESGSGLCPQRPHGNNSFVLSRNTGSLFTALSIGSHGNQHLIMRAFGPHADQIRTRKSSHWLDDPQFVAMYDLDPFVYIFFREVAVEHIPWGKLIVSRVARICKGDKGGAFNRNEFKSFIKARLNCSRPGEYPFHFDELQGIHLDAERKVFVGTFTTSPNALPGSAVCEFHLDDINLTFNKNFKVYDYTCQCWRGGQTNKQLVCKTEDLSSNDEFGPNLLELLTIDGAVQPIQPNPLIEAPLERFVHVITTTTEIEFKGKETMATVVYVSTSEGEVRRYLTLQGHQRSSCPVETIQVLPPSGGQSIQFMNFNPVTGLVIVGTTDRVYQISRERCHRFNTKTLCESAQDPFCGWSQFNQMCVPSVKPTITSCPIVKNLKRTWYGWSDWSKCSVTCGDGIQMRMLVCLDDLGRLSTSSDLRNALRCSGNNYVTRPCKLKSCVDTSITPWTTWMTNESPLKNSLEQQIDRADGQTNAIKEKRFRCLCEQDNVNRCSATLQVSERTCRGNGECSSRLKRLVDKREGQYRHHQHQNGQTLKKCAKELTEKKEENVKMKKQIHEMMSHKNHYHRQTNPHPTAVIIARTPRTTTPSTDHTTPSPPHEVKVVVKSMNSNHESSKINIGERRKQQHKHHHNNNNLDNNNLDNNNLDNNNLDNYDSNLLPEFDTHNGFLKVDPSPSRPRSVENQIKNSQKVRYHHFSLPQNIYQRHKTTPTTPTTTSTASPRCQTTCPDILPVNYGIFYGYCGCRDLGLFRVCHKCNSI